MIDFHSHIDLYPDPKAVINECVKRKLYVLSVTTTPSAWEITASLAQDAPRIQTALGLHPQIAHQRYNELELFDSLLTGAKYVGEIGLDGSLDHKVHLNIQKKVFSHILKSCDRGGGYVMSIHSRGAVSPLLDEIRKFPNSGIPVLHWFSGTKTELDKAVGMDCWFSVGPAMLLSKKGKEIVGRIPKDRILTESDGPFAKLDGEVVMPWDAGKTNEHLARIWGLSLKDTHFQLKENLKKILSIGKNHAVT